MVKFTKKQIKDNVSYESIQKATRNKRIESILNYPGYKNYQRSIIQKYYGHLQRGSLRLESKRAYLQSIKLLLLDLEKQPDEVSKSDINAYLDKIEKKYKPKTIFERRKFLINFFEWYYGKTQDEIDIIKNITIKKHNGIKLPDEILSPLEIKKMVQVADNFRDKAIILLLYENATRKGEFLQLRIKHLELTDQKFGLITIPMGKTDSRKLPIIYSIPHIQNWLNSHPDRDNPESPLFITQGAWLGRALGEDGLKRLLKITGQRAGIKKRIYPHLFRHSRLTELAKELTEQELKKYAGWTPNSNMASVYVHLSGSDVSNKVLANAGFIDQAIVQKGKSLLHSIKCPRCDKINGSENKYCSCGFVLDIKEVNMLLEKEKNFQDKMVNFIDPESIKKLFKTVEMLTKDIENMKKS